MVVQLCIYTKEHWIVYLKSYIAWITSSYFFKEEPPEGWRGMSSQWLMAQVEGHCHIHPSSQPSKCYRALVSYYLSSFLLMSWAQARGKFSCCLAQRKRLRFFKDYFIKNFKRSRVGNKNVKDFPGGAVVKNPPANAGDTGLIPGLGRPHMPQSN